MCCHALGLCASSLCALGVLAGCHHLFPYQPGPAEERGRDGPLADRAPDVAWRQEPGRPDARKDTCWQFSDDFEDETIDQTNIGVRCPQAPPDATAAVKESGGWLRIAPLPGMNDTCYLNYHPAGKNTVNLSGGAFQVRVPQTVARAYGVEMGLTVLDAGGWQVDIVKGTDEIGTERITFRSWDGQTRDPEAKHLSFLPSSHSHWRIHHSAPSTVTWQTSSDGNTWTPQRVDPSCPINFAAVDVLVWAGTYSPVASPGEAAFDDLVVSSGGCL